MPRITAESLETANLASTDVPPRQQLDAALDAIVAEIASLQLTHEAVQQTASSMLRMVSKLRQHLARSDADFEWQGMVAKAKIDELIELHGKMETDATEAACVRTILGKDLEEERARQLALEPELVRRKQQHEHEQRVVIAKAEVEGEQLDAQLIEACLANEKQQREFPIKRASLNKEVNETHYKLREIKSQQDKVESKMSLIKLDKGAIEKDQMMLQQRGKVLQTKADKAQQTKTRLEKMASELKGLEAAQTPAYKLKKNKYDQQEQQAKVDAKKQEAEEEALALEQVAMIQRVEQLDAVEAELKDLSEQFNARFLNISERNKQLRVEEKRLKNERNQSAEVMSRVRGELAALDETLEHVDNERLTDEFDEARQREALKRIGRLETQLLEEQVKFGILQEELPLERASLEAAVASLLSEQEKLLPQLSKKMIHVLSFDAEALRGTVSKSVWTMMESVSAVGKRAYAPEQQRELCHTYEESNAWSPLPCLSLTLCVSGC